MVKKVAIVDSEPCGVMMAHYLLKRSDRALNRSLRCQDRSALYRVFQGKNLPNRPNQAEKYMRFLQTSRGR